MLLRRLNEFLALPEDGQGDDNGDANGADEDDDSD